MSWASRRRTIYLGGVIFFFGLLTGVPLIMWWYEPATCFDGKQNQGETVTDKGGPCKLLDERALIPYALQWSRSFPVRNGLWSATAYIENPNEDGAVISAPYRFKLYDDRNVLVAEKNGTTYLMPGTITAVYEGAIDTGNRKVTRTFFEFTAPLVWERYANAVREITVTDKRVVAPDRSPRVSARIENTSVTDARELFVVAVVFDASGNALASSRTVIPLLESGEQQEVVFTWPTPFIFAPARVDILPLLAPIELE